MKIAEYTSEGGQTTTAPRIPPPVIRRSRPLLLPERTMFRDGRTPFCSVFTIRLLGRLEEPQLWKALERVQKKHPLLRCVVKNDSLNGPYFVLQNHPAPIPLRIVERKNEDDWQREVCREWVTPFDAGRGPLLRLVWLRSISVHELLLIGHHCICDGQSGITILRDLLAACDDPEQDIGAYDALGAIEDIVPADLLQSPRFQRRARLKANMLRLAFHLKRAGRGEKPAAHISHEQMYFHRWAVDETWAKYLTERSRAEDVTVLAPVGLAFMQAFRDVRGAERLRKAYTMVNARRFVPRLHPDALFGIVPGIELRMKDLPAPQEISAGDFWLRARMLKQDMTRRIARLGGSVYNYLAALETLHDKYSRLVADTENAPAVRHLTISNMGKIDLSQQYRSFRLESVYSPLVMVSPTPANTVVLSSFAGQMEFAIISDEVSLPYADALKIQQRTMEILDACLASPLQEKPGLAYKSITEQTT
jgi:hypothetical protein